MSFIATFYSYKGGVGRTMAMANIAVLLAQRGLKVLVVDWDLEAPGLEYYFDSRPMIPGKKQTGLLGLLLDSIESGENVNWKDYISEIDVKSKHKLNFLDSGVGSNKKVINKLLSFDWAQWYREKNGGVFIESLRQEWLNNFDAILIDSRSGLTDIGGICTIQLPDILVIVFRCTYQSLLGARNVALTAKAEQSNLDFDRAGLTVFPLLSLFEGRTEYQTSKEWLSIFANKLEPFYRDWLDRNRKPIEVIEKTKIPYVAYFSFGETLPVITEGYSDPESLGYAYLNIAKLIENEFSENAVSDLLNNDHPNDNTRIDTFWICLGTTLNPHPAIENLHDHNCPVCGKQRTLERLQIGETSPKKSWICEGKPSYRHLPIKNVSPVCPICGKRQRNEQLNQSIENIKIPGLLSLVVILLTIVAYFSQVSINNSTDKLNRLLFETAIEEAKRGNTTIAVDKLCQIPSSSEEFRPASALLRTWYNNPELRPHVESYLEVLKLQAKSCPSAKNLPEYNKDR